jgi:hypothetical protein
MPTSLVSTGVQFPDSSIQTTAASAAPVVLISSTVVSSAVSSLTFSVSASSVYAYYMLYMKNPVCAGGSNRSGRFRVSRDGSTFLTNTSYLMGYDSYESQGYMGFFNSSAGSSGVAVQSLSYINVADTGLFTVAQIHMGCSPSNSATTGTFSTASSWQGGGANIVAFMLLPETGVNITAGTYSFYGVRK